MIKRGYFLLSLLVSNMAFATSMNEAFNQGRDVGKGNNSNAQQIMKDFQPSQIQGYQARPKESQYYTGVKGGNPNLTATGMNALENSESGKAIKSSVINNPKVEISQDSDFIKSSNNIRNNAEVISGIKSGQCVNKVLNKTSFTSHFCEKEQDINKICKNTAIVKWSGERKVIDNKELKLELGKDIKTHFESRGSRDYVRFNFYYNLTLPKNIIVKGYDFYYDRAFRSGVDNTWASARNLSFELFGKKTNISEARRHKQLIQIRGLNEKVSTDGSIRAVLMGGANRSGTRGAAYRASQFTKQVLGYIKIYYSEEIDTLKPRIEWVNSCGNFDDSNLIKINEKCTSPGGERNFFKDGKTFKLHSDCWESQTEYLVSESSDNECKKYENNPNCTVGERECILNNNGSCTRHRIKYQCQTTTKTDGYICGDKFFCSDGSCADLEGSVNSDFGHAVSQLATLAQAGKDVGLDPEHLKAFSGQPMFCRKSGFGFSDCCKDSGWGHKAGLAKCNSEENALGKAKEKKLVVYVGTFCSKKVLKKCIQRKSGYCVFDNKLARIIQYQGRSGQLGIGFGGAESPDCRGITVDELQRIDFNAMDYSDFYDELNERTNLPDKQQLMEHMRNSIINQLQEK